MGENNLIISKKVERCYYCGESIPVFTAHFPYSEYFGICVCCKQKLDIAKEKTNAYIKACKPEHLKKKKFENDMDYFYRTGKRIRSRKSKKKRNIGTYDLACCPQCNAGLIEYEYGVECPDCGWNALIDL